MDSTNIEVGVIREDKKFQVLTPSQIKEYLDELQWVWFSLLTCILSWMYFLIDLIFDQKNWMNIS